MLVLDKENKIAYLSFPTEESELKKARGEGFEIIDIRFIPEALKPKAKAKSDEQSISSKSSGPSLAQGANIGGAAQ